MDLATIEQNVGEVDVTQGFDLIYDLLAAYGMPKASITRLRKGSANKSDREDEVLWKGKVYFRDLTLAEDAPDPHAAIDDAAREERVTKQQPRFLVVRSGDRLLGVDTKTSDSLDIPLDKLGLSVAFFMPWAGMEKTHLEAAHYADIKAAEKMARLYDETRKVNEVESDEEVHALNVFFTRLLFCFFAEDTGIFEDGQVTKAIGSLTHQDGSDLHHFLGKLFETLDTPVGERGDLPSYLSEFGYVNGRLFAQRNGIPTFSAKARGIILECAELDWSEISPDVFGSMMQAVVKPEARATLGMHYTSVENILKVLRPLVLDELEAAYEAAADDPRRLRRLHDRLARLVVMDPACGSGNFLTTAYREVRGIEHRILIRLRDLAAETSGSKLFEVSRVPLTNFVGIEIDDFAHEVAQLALWLTKHQMNVRFAELFGVLAPLIPLRDAARITCGDATRLDWGSLCSFAEGADIVVCGNPPYVGSSMQSARQKADIREWFGPRPYSKKMDYVGLWILKGAEFVGATGARLAFVTTNSVCQGDHVGMLFPAVFAAGVQIPFAHTSFKWTNSARGGAGVTCVVLGLSRADSKPKRLYSDGVVVEVPHIGPYLRPSSSDTIVARSSRPISPLPPMLTGNKPSDGGHLNLSPTEAGDLVSANPIATQFLREYVGSSEFLSGAKRYCLWIEDADLPLALSVPAVRARIDAVRDFRLHSSEGSTRAMATQPHRFYFACHRSSTALIVPSTSSEARAYVPIGFVGPNVVVSNAANVVYDAAPWLFGLLQSRMHMDWLGTVGGRLKTDYRYSAVLVYNTFPAPDLDGRDRDALGAAALAVLGSREQFAGTSLAELYGPDRMPAALRAAHDALDAIVDTLYHPRGFGSDDDRVDHLFSLYETRVNGT